MARCYRYVAFAKREGNRAGNASLRAGEKCVERFAQGREPHSVIDHFRVAQRKNLLVMRGFAVESKRLKFAAGDDEQSSAGRFIGSTRLNTDQAIFDDVHTADTVGGGDFVQLREQRDGVKLFAI